MSVSVIASIQLVLVFRCTSMPVPRSNIHEAALGLINTIGQLLTCFLAIRRHTLLWSPDDGSGHRQPPPPLSLALSGPAPADME